MNRRLTNADITQDMIGLLLLMAVMFFIAVVGGFEARQEPNPTGAVCTTDSDCARWEVENNIAPEHRVFGAPAPAEVR